MKKAGIGIVAVLAAAVFGFVAFGALDRYIYEFGLNLNLKLVAVAVLGLVILATAFAMLMASFRRSKAD
ncbi:MAG TPA: hypothetical protein VIA80_12670 [Hyphomonadaceae bacterium]|jgi:hypothetical protein